jgi:hypothetical protein
MAGKNSGSKMVGAAVGGIIAFLGVGTFYLPFIADKDRVRGLHEESTMSPGDQREYEAMLKEMGKEMPPTPEAKEKKPFPTNNSMWKRMGDAPKSDSPKS